MQKNKYLSGTKEHKKKEKKSTIFLKILLVIVAIFIALALYAYKMIKDEKEKTQKESIVVVTNTPIHHPPLTQREKKEDDKTTTPIVNNDTNKSLENNTTRNIPEGAEYISVEEQLKREQEENLSNIPTEEIYDDSQVIPQDEIDNYEDAVTVSVESQENSIKPTVTPTQTSNHSNSLGTLIETDNQQNSNLGTLISDETVK